MVMQAGSFKNLHTRHLTMDLKLLGTEFSLWRVLWTRNKVGKPTRGGGTGGVSVARGRECACVHGVRAWACPCSLAAHRQPEQIP